MFQVHFKNIYVGSKPFEKSGLRFVYSQNYFIYFKNCSKIINIMNIIYFK